MLVAEEVIRKQNKINQVTRKYLGIMRAVKKIVLCGKTAGRLWVGVLL